MTVCYARVVGNGSAEFHTTLSTQNDRSTSSIYRRSQLNEPPSITMQQQSVDQDLEVREFEGTEWVKKRDYDALQKTHSDFQRATKARLAECWQELFPGQEIDSDEEEHPQERWDLTRVKGLSMDSGSDAEVEIFRVVVVNSSSTSGSSSSGSGQSLMFLPRDCLIVIASHPSWTHLSDADRKSIKIMVDNQLFGGGTKVPKVGDKDKVARMIGAIQEDGQSRPKAIPNNTTTFVMADTFRGLVDSCYSRMMGGVARAARAAAHAAAEGGNAAGPSAAAAMPAASADAATMPPELVQRLAWMTDVATVHVPVGDWNIPSR